MMNFNSSALHKWLHSASYKEDASLSVTYKMQNKVSSPPYKGIVIREVAHFIQLQFVAVITQGAMEWFGLKITHLHSVSFGFLNTDVGFGF